MLWHVQLVLFFGMQFFTILLQAEMDHFVDDGTLDDNVESYLSHEDADPKVNPFAGVSKGTIIMIILVCEDGKI